MLDKQPFLMFDLDVNLNLSGINSDVVSSVPLLRVPLVLLVPQVSPVAPAPRWVSLPASQRGSWLWSQK